MLDAGEESLCRWSGLAGGIVAMDSASIPSSVRRVSNDQSLFDQTAQTIAMLVMAGLYLSKDHVKQIAQSYDGFHLALTKCP